MVESNIRKLVNDLEKNEFILIAHVNTEAVELPPEPEGNRFLIDFVFSIFRKIIFSVPDLFRDGFLDYHFIELKFRFKKNKILKNF